MKLFVKRHLKKILTISLAVVILASIALAGFITSNASGTGAGLAEWALNAYNSHWRYQWGGASPGAVDCSGLIYSYCGGARTDLEQYATEIGYVSAGIPRVHGLGLHQPGHYGVYVGDGMAVDARGDEYGVCYESVATKSWVEWFKVGAVSYVTNGWEKFNGQYYYYENGQYVVNTSRNIGGVTYHFGSNGASDKTPADMNAVANNSGSSSNSNNNNNNSSSSNKSDSKPKEDSKPGVLKVGSSGDNVTKLQERLAELGFYNGEVTGYFGDATEAAYKAFQKAAGLTPDGIAGEDELELLYSDEAPTAKVEKKKDTEKEKKDDGIYSLGDQGDKVSEIQQQLADLGYYNGEITGYFGEVTEQAVKDFQTINGLEATGVVDENTYNVLFSELAVANTVEEEQVEETYEEPTEAETEPATEAPVKKVEKAKSVSQIAGENLDAAQKVVVKTNRLTKNALKSYDKETVDITANGRNNGGFLVWLFVVLGIAAAVTGVLFIMSKRNAAYSGARVKGAKKKPEVPVRYW